MPSDPVAAGLEEASKNPPTPIKVTPIPPPSIPLPPAMAPAAAAQPSTTSSAASPAALPALLPAAASASTTTPISLTVVPPHPSSIPQKRALADDDRPLQSPGVSSAAPEELPNVAVREKRAKKDSLKKRESKAAAGWDGVRPPATEPKRKEPAGAAGATTTSGNGTAHGAASDSAPGATEPVSKVSKNPPPKTGDDLPARVPLPGPLRPTDFEPPASPIFRSRHSLPVAGGQEIEFFELLSEQPINRRGYVYESGIADPRFPSSHYFRQTEPKPHYAHFSFEDAPPNMFFDQSGLHVSGEGGFRTTRANTAVRQGRWYWECRVTRGIVGEGSSDRKQGAGQGAGEPEARGHVRMGWARREASRDAPVGADAYGYGIRDRRGQKVHMSRPKEFLAEDVDVREGDVVGLEIQLPSEALHRKVVQGTYNPAVDRMDDEEGREDGSGPNVVRDRIPFRFQQNKPVFEKFDYQPVKELEDLANPAPTLSASSAGAVEPPNPHHRVPCLRTLPGSYIRVYRNGVLQGTPYAGLLAFLPPTSTTNAKLQEGARERLDDGTLGYYPAVSTFRGGAAEVNFGPDFWFPPPDMAAADVDGDKDEDVAALKPVSLTALRPVSERYAEQIAEDIVYDIVDEAYYWLLDGGGGGGSGSGGSVGPAEPVAAATTGSGSNEVVMED